MLRLWEKSSCCLGLREGPGAALRAEVAKKRAARQVRAAGATSLSMAPVYGSQQFYKNESQKLKRVHRLFGKERSTRAYNRSMVQQDGREHDQDCMHAYCQTLLAVFNLPGACGIAPL